MEHHGHGRSVVAGGTLGMVESFDRLLDDAQSFCAHIVKNQPPGSQWGIMGHSMGGAIALYLGDRVADLAPGFLGVSAVAPSVGGATPGGVTLTALSFVSWAWPSLAVGPPEHPEMYDTGSGLELNYGGAMRASTASLFVNDIYPRTAQLLAMSPEEREELAMNFPLVIWCGDKDGLVPFKLMRDTVIPGAQTHDKELVKLKGKDHQPLLSEGWEQVAANFVAWFASRRC